MQHLWHQMAPCRAKLMIIFEAMPVPGIFRAGCTHSEHQPRASAIHTLSARMLRHWFTAVILQRVVPHKNEVQSKQTARATAATAALGKQSSLQGSSAGTYMLKMRI